MLKHLIVMIFNTIGRFPHRDSTVLQIYKNVLTTCHVPNVIILVFLIASLKCFGFQIPLQMHFVAWQCVHFDGQRENRKTNSPTTSRFYL